MAKVISQETFDDVVKENIVEFEMEPVEAKEETVKQFEAQGINLANIIKDLSLNEKTGQPLLNESIDVLKMHVSGATLLDDTALLDQLNVIQLECEKSIPHRVLAASTGAAEVLLAIIESSLSANVPNREILRKCIKVENSLLNKYPDIFAAETLLMTIRILDSQTEDSELICSVLRMLQKACVMHEINRQNIVNAEIMRQLKPLIRKDEATVIAEVCTLFRYLILDDDIRVEFGKAHEHARIIAAEVLQDLTLLLDKFKESNVTVCSLLFTIASLAVRSEFCVEIEKAGGLKFIIHAMTHQSENLKLMKEVFRLIRALAGNDDVKVKVIQQGAAPHIENVLNIHKNDETLAKLALLSVSTLALRTVANSEELFKTGIAETIVETMKLHPKSKAVQRNGAWAIRNMISRSRDQCKSFITFGAEDVLNEAMKEHPSAQQDIKAALRDLGAKITLNEEWTATSSYKIERD